MFFRLIFDERAASLSRVPSHSGQTVNVTARSTKARTCGCNESGSLASKELADLRDQAGVGEVDALDLDFGRLLVEQGVEFFFRELA